MIKHTLEILQNLLQDFESVSDHFGTLSIKRLIQLFLRASTPDDFYVKILVQIICLVEQSAFVCIEVYRWV